MRLGKEGEKGIGEGMEEGRWRKNRKRGMAGRKKGKDQKMKN